jgi:hypothetical protein
MAFPTYPLNNIGREIIPFQIANQSGYRGQLYFYLVGTTDPTNPDHEWYYLSDLDGNVTKCVPTQGETSYSMPIADSQAIKLPRLSAMRMYFSFGAPLNLVVGSNGIPASPAGWLTDSNYRTLFDWIELTWEKNPNDYTLGGNTTQVDMFGIPFALSFTGFDPSGSPLTVQGGFSQGGLRNTILDALRGAPSPWSSLVVTDPDTGTDLRAVSPYHGMEMNLFPRDQLQGYIDDVWTTYTTKTLSASAEDVTFAGQVANGLLTFTPTTGGTTITFPKPDSFTVYTSGPVPQQSGGKLGVIQAALQADFLRSTLLASNLVPECDSGLYYQSPPINHYAKILHQYATGGGAYAFGFDDVCSKSSFIIVHNPVSAGVTLLGF